MGGVLGFDLPALMQVADTMDYDREILIHLLPMVERAMVAQLNSHADT